MADLPGLRLVRPSDVETMVFDWGTIKWMSEPRVTHTSGFTMGVVLLEPGKGHERHNHPGCEEILYVVSGPGSQMIDVAHERTHPVAAARFVLLAAPRLAAHPSS